MDYNNRVIPRTLSSLNSYINTIFTYNECWILLYRKPIPKDHIHKNEDWNWIVMVNNFAKIWNTYILRLSACYENVQREALSTGG